MPAPDQTLDGEQGLFRVGDSLAFGRLADKPLIAIGKGNHGRCCARALGVLDHPGVLAVHDGDT